ncbi:MAG: sodium:solute symporter [Candidatus Hermodarchaeota archaeon]
MALEAGAEIWFWIVLVAYLAFLAIAGYYAKKKTKTLEDFMVAGRQISPFLVGLSFGVTYFSAVMIVGGGQFSWLWGLAVVWIASIDVLVGVFMVFVFFGERTKKLGEHFESMTVPQFLSKRYDEERIRAFTSIVILFFETIYLVSIYMGLSLLISIIMPGNPYAYPIAVVICATITIFYLNVGGAHGAIWTDAAEAMIMLVGVILIFIFGIIAVGGFDGLTGTLGQIERDEGYPAGGLTTFLGAGGMGLIGYILVTSFGVWGMPQMISRFYTAEKKKPLRWALVVSCVWAFVVAIFAWFNGAIARAYFYRNDRAKYNEINSGLPWTVGESAVPNLMVAVLPIAIAAIFLAAVTAASLTTGEKVIMMAASGFSIDVYQRKTGCSDDRALYITKITTTAVVIIAVGLALLKIGAVLALCMFAWSAMAAVILVPYVFGLFWKKGTAKAALYCGVIALIAALAWKLCMRGYDVFYAVGGASGLRIYGILFGQARSIPVLSSPWLSFRIGDIHEFIISQVAAVIAFPVISKFTQGSKPSDEFLKEIFDVMTGKR